MKLYEKEIQIPVTKNHQKLLDFLEAHIKNELQNNETALRLAVTKTDDQNYHVEIGVMSSDASYDASTVDPIFNFKRRKIENTDNFTAVLLIPTGINAELGGHSGDGGPLARLIASACDTLITHPNVVNAADVNELPENGLYVEGSVISRLMMGTVGLQKVRANRVALIMDDHDETCISEHSINSASTARAAFGLDCPIVVKMTDKIGMYAEYSESSGCAAGRIDNLENLVEVLNEHRDKFDAVALASTINVPKNFHTDYFLTEMANPWGGVEAMLTHSISSIFDVPSAHAPMMESSEILNLNVGVVEPRKAAETVSVTYLHCVLKGLHRSPKIIDDESLFDNSNVLSVSDVSCLIIPDGCVGLPTLAALEQEIPVIAVRENKNLMKNKLEDFPFAPGKLFIVDNYLEAIGVMQAIKAGVALETVRRPLAGTNVYPKLRKEIYENVIRFRAK